MQFLPYLTFDGNAAEAMRAYERIFGGRLEKMMTFADLPPEALAGMANDPGCAGRTSGPMSAADRQRVLHAALRFEDGMLMASDTMPGMPYNGQHNVGVAVTLPTVERARAVFEALGEGGAVEMAFGETFWSEAFGGVKDRFGTHWLINGGKAKM